MEHTNEKISTGFMPYSPMVLLRDVAKRWLLILLTAVAVGVGTYIYTQESYTPVYKTTTTYVVTTHSSVSTVYSNLNSASGLANVFSELLNSSVMRKTILQQLGTDSFQGSIQAAVIPETNLLTVTVTASDPRTAFSVAQAIRKYHELVTDQVLDSIALEVLQQPQVPVAPMNRTDAGGQMKKMALIAAVVMAVLLAALSYSRNAVRSGKEARDKLDCVYLGEIPHEKKYKTLPAWLRHSKTGILITAPATSFRFAEAIRKLRHRVEQHMENGRVLMVTSLLENEGKSTVAVNLALSLSQKHEKVLLIDCDLRKPACCTLLGQERFSVGLRDVLSGKAKPQEAILRDRKSKLALLLERQAGMDSGDRIGSAEMVSLLQWAAKEYTYVILDMPPMSEVSDAESMTAYADAALLVVRQNAATAPAINKAVETLSSGKAKLLGCTLNDADSQSFRTVHGYGRYRYYGGYGNYGETNR